MNWRMKPEPKPRKHGKYLDKRLPVNCKSRTLDRWTEREDAKKWCEEYFGTPMLVLKPNKYSSSGGAYHRNPEGKWAYYYDRYYFRNAADAMLFKLTWG